MAKKTVEFDYDVGEEVLIKGLRGGHGFVLSLWYSTRGPMYEISYFSNGDHYEMYLGPWEIEPVHPAQRIGFTKE